MARQKPASQIRRQISGIKLHRLASEKVVSLADFRRIRESEKTPTILVVDDDEVMRSAMKRLLERGRYQVILASDGLELSRVLETSQLDMILLDVNLPWVDGFELCRIVREHPSLTKIPIIFVSARKEESDIRRGVEAGANDYIAKPFDVEYVMDKIDQFLRVS